MTCDPTDCFRCPCGRTAPCADAGDTEPATPNPGTGPSEPTLGDRTDDAPESWGSLEADSPETNDPDGILHDAKSRDFNQAFALVSGGYDSVAAAHYTYHNAPFALDGVIHIDTSIGLRETTDYTERFADDLGLELHVADVRRDADEYATRIETYGFPGANETAHKWEWVNNKDKPLQTLLTQFDGTTLLVSGATREESDARFEKVDADGLEVKDGHLYASPLAAWTPSDVKAYIDQQGIRRSEVVEHLSHSGDCLCGSYADRWLELDVIRDEWPYMWAYIQSLEARVIDSARNGDMKKESYEDYVLWGHGSTTERELDQRLGNREMTLCQACEPAAPGLSPGDTYLTLTEAALGLEDSAVPDSETAFRDAFDVTQAIPEDSDEHPLEVLRRGYEALDDVADRLGYDGHWEMVEDRAEEPVAATDGGENQ
ncbi:phosphoadenosine phosphosulfate reductase family protein [Natrinema sp. DC36]|uniref:phosphoadenosine phosphosulfate reductase family protein n=1 Tax=Natrinema sp. DC36 TaxID=2878680 RepID=UPI001CF0521A|nr:phosphoadenosine phosphosulfate reductase family protein [Natrinema sp. DC36]